MIKRRKHNVPNLNLASMPDLIFTVLFFFMISTHMRSSAPKIKVETPQGTMLLKPEHKSALVYVYVGEGRVQVGNRVLPTIEGRGLAEAMSVALADERRRMSADDRQQMVVCLKADKKTPMQLILQVKQALREARVGHIFYSAQAPLPKS